MRNVLVLCTGNSCRSIMAEALFNQLGQGQFQAWSAGSKPTGTVHPQALACLERNQVPVAEPYSKSWNQFTETQLDLVVTVCDRAAGESCPIYPGAPVKVHWGFPDPADATGTDEEIAAEFQAVFTDLHAQIAAFVAMANARPDLSIAELIARFNGPANDTGASQH